MARKCMFEWDAVIQKWVAKSSDYQARNNFILQAWKMMWKDKMNMHGAWGNLKSWFPTIPSGIVGRLKTGKSRNDTVDTVARRDCNYKILKGAKLFTVSECDLWALA